MKLAAQIVGVIAVIVYVISCQPRKRSTLILLNVISKALFITQYIMLGAFTGATLDVLCFVTSIIAGQKNNAKIKKYSKILFIAALLTILSVGVSMTINSRNWVNMLATIGVCFQVVALWQNDTNGIRKITLISLPLGLSYNLLSGAYGASLGDIFGIASVLLALWRHRKT